MVTLKVPVVALLLEESVKVLAVVAGLGLKEAVVPERMPEAEKVTAPVKPLDGVMVTVAPPVLPRAMFRVAGEAEREKFGAAFTVTEIVVEPFRLPLTPLMVTVNVPTAAPRVAVNVKELVLVVLDGLKLAVTPLGRPEADKLTFPVKGLCGVTVMVVGPLVVPSVTAAEFDDAVTTKLPCGGPDTGQLFTRFAALTVPIPVAKSQPTELP